MRLVDNVILDHASCNFNPRTSYEVRPYMQAQINVTSSYFNPRTSYEVRLSCIPKALAQQRISIHALHTKCDLNDSTILAIRKLFQSTHFIRSATKEGWDNMIGLVFQSTHFIRSATSPSPSTYRPGKNFNPRTSYEVRPDFYKGQLVGTTISIHALHTKCDKTLNDLSGRCAGISIHALHTKCDCFSIFRF